MNFEVPPTPPANTVTPQTPDMYTRAAQNATVKYGHSVSPIMLRAIQMQESSGTTTPSNYNLAMGVTPTAIKSLGKDALPATSLDNVVQNSANYLASRAVHTYPDGTTKDMSSPENWSEWYTQKYVGLLPGKSRVINGQVVTHDQVKASFEKILQNLQQPRTLPAN